ncbi:hypothetical protein [Streptomyces sp. CB01373]|uniref:hypothetical protein n=1 Tax=Streptomyces sp. CB01373 TaxID=2020325 RepID=UPI00131D5060
MTQNERGATPGARSASSFGVLAYYAITNASARTLDPAPPGARCRPWASSDA